jgi:hypothetical protein
VGLDKVTEGAYVDGKWKEGRWLNGDQTHQGRHVQLPAGEFAAQKVTVYKFK